MEDDVVDLTLDASDADTPARAENKVSAEVGAVQRGGLPPRLQAAPLEPPERPHAPSNATLRQHQGGRRRRAAARVEPVWLGEASQSEPYATPGDEDWAPSHLGREATGGKAAKGKKRGGAAKPKRTREQIAQEAEEKRQRKAAEAVVRKEQREYDSGRHVLKFVTAVMDPEFMVTAMGIEIAKAFQATQAKLEHERIAYRVAPTGLVNLPAMRWQRKVPVEPAAEPTAAAATGASGSSAGGSSLVEKDEPHVMLCFEAEDFVSRVLQDGMGAVFAQLARHCPGMRPHIVVHRLSQHLQQRERSEHRAAMQAGAHGHGFQRRPVDDFIARLAVECPGAAFREVRSADEAASHACSTTVAIARRFNQKSEAAKYLASQGGAKKVGQNLAALLATHPVEDFGARICMSALCTLPSVGPQIAHSMASRYGSIGALMEALFDPGRSVAEKVKELEVMQRVGPARGTKVGPKAARQLYDLLTGDNPDVRVHGETE